MLRPITLSLCLTLLAACAPPSGTDRLPMASTGMIAQGNTLITVQRAGAGNIRPLTHSADLQAAAQFHADDMAMTGGIGHRSSDGSSLSDRIARSGYQACFAAENVAQGQPDVRSVIAAWANSPDHYANMVNASATQFGFARSGNAWVLVVARPC